MSDYSPAEIYRDNLGKLNEKLNRLNQKKTALAWLRLGSFLASVAALWLVWPQGWLPVIATFVVLFGIFLYIVSIDIDNNEAIENTRLLIQLQEQELAALDHQFTQFPDGHQWAPSLHEYALDLDIFGRASVFQYINRATSEQGQQLLASWLLAPAPANVIEERQQAIKELTPQTAWRQQLQAYGMTRTITLSTEKNIAAWLKEKNQFIDKFYWKLLRWLLPASSCTILVLHLAGIIPGKQFYPLMLLFLVIALTISKMIMPAYTRLNKITAELETLSASVRWIEKANFESFALISLKKKYDTEDRVASHTIHRLKKILDRLDYRLNPIVFIPLSIFLCWDLQQAFALEKWKTTNKQQVGEWFAGLAEFEVLSSLANLSFNHPGWCFPAISSKEAVFITDEMGHPLIQPGKRVNNSFATAGTSQLGLITGSNMAGKSTFLRSAGVNIVLAMMGSPVCARRLVVSPMKVMSSMRISDNLEENTSTFYAELKKLKEIIEAVNRNEKVFLLLDEMLRGTNSADRHIGSMALIRQLIHHKGNGLVATHDLELAGLTSEYPDNIHNYHFDVQVANNELYFDYKLKEGICRSMNATILMKKIGIEL